MILEVLRARYIPAIRAQAGLLAFAAIGLITRGAPYAYINPANGKSFGDPINVWYHFFSPASAPIDPIRLYVGNVPGPVFATSLLAVAIGAAWFAYARRVSLVVLITFLLGALVPIYSFHWDYLFQLDSGPLWFVAALVLSRPGATSRIGGDPSCTRFWRRPACGRLEEKRLRDRSLCSPSSPESKP